MQKLSSQLKSGLDEMDLVAKQSQFQKLLDLVDLLLRWNKKINLTSITKPHEVISKHILDSLSMVPHISGDNILDVGTGAGFPGLPLAIMLPDTQFTLLDSNRKKLTFIQHVITKLGLENVRATHSRIQDHHSDRAYSAITARAFADLNDLLNWLPEVYDAHTQILAMKGKMPEKELESLRSGLL
ncbi:MAG: 16S rRNA (guanine(527)-N(7))-methyltransferase RsmG, partial [Gammaproteobacteria bacterium]|nr:16S rRNA (guanine(527)-N(7))-methyltransferase RsmG [Gammaproteobacteria bacterium]NNM13020.1 16S rRNA (guanine(527)-N(7))-methyltransferase RsmG [Gammaproteobacteria bacterium]